MIEVSVPQCLQLLTNIGHRWKEAAACADRLRPLLQRISTAFEISSSEVFHPYDDAAITAEIQGLLFSDGPLIWNQTTQVDDLFAFDDGAMFFENPLLEDMEFFKWDPEWDIMPAEII
jgi:hypothetical protein